MVHVRSCIERVKNYLFSDVMCENYLEIIVDYTLNYELAVQGGSMKKGNSNEIISEDPLELYKLRLIILFDLYNNF